MRDGRSYGAGPYLRAVRRAGPLAGNWRAPRLPLVPWPAPTEVDLSAPATFFAGENGTWPGSWTRSRSKSRDAARPLALPGARILEFADGAIRPASYDELPLVQLHRSFLAAPERFLRHLL